MPMKLFCVEEGQPSSVVSFRTSPIQAPICSSTNVKLLFNFLSLNIVGVIVAQDDLLMEIFSMPNRRWKDCTNMNYHWDDSLYHLDKVDHWILPGHLLCHKRCLHLYVLMLLKTLQFTLLSRTHETFLGIIWIIMYCFLKISFCSGIL